MFNNIGRKIKVLAKVLCWIGIVLSILAGAGFLVAYFKMSGYIHDPQFLVAAICCFVFGPLLAWLNNMLLYGFGELVDKTMEIEKTVKRNHGNNF